MKIFSFLQIGFGQILENDELESRLSFAGKRYDQLITQMSIYNADFSAAKLWRMVQNFKTIFFLIFLIFILWFFGHFLVILIIFCNFLSIFKP